MFIVWVVIFASSAILLGWNLSILALSIITGILGLMVVLFAWKIQKAPLDGTTKNFGSIFVSVSIVFFLVVMWLTAWAARFGLMVNAFQNLLHVVSPHILRR